MADDRIVVGVDGSEGGRRALRWAVHEAADRGRTVQAVIAWRADAAGSPQANTDPAREKLRAEKTLHDELAAVNAGPVVVAAEAAEGRAAEVLCAAARDADLLVLGSHGHSRTWHTVLGSVSEECVGRAQCPIVVIPVPVPPNSRGTAPPVPGGSKGPDG